MPPRTIDNLGVDIYTRYAEDQANFDKSLITDSGKVFSQATVDISMPAYRTQFRLLLGISFLHPQWASFSTPELYEGRKKNIFTSQILPFMGSTDKKEAQKERVKKRPEREREKEEKKGRPRWKQDKEEQDKKKEKNTLLALFSCLETLNNDMIEILAKTKQFQKG